MSTASGPFESTLAGAKRGDEWAITALYRELHPSLLRYLRAQAPKDGEDIASQVWVDVASALVRFAGDESAFRRWLFTIARRRLIDYRRRETRRRTAMDLPAASLASESFDPERQALAASETEVALSRLASLAPDQAEVVFLRILAGLDVEDVAAILGKTPGAIRVLQHRALKRLREQLATEQAQGVTR
jgi:RNA polymerase sigma-70 factor, ECF subfamily